MNKLLLVALALSLTGCATARTLNAAQPGAPLVYAGTRLDLYAMQGGCCAMDRFGAQAPSYPGLDLPASSTRPARSRRRTLTGVPRGDFRCAPGARR